MIHLCTLISAMDIFILYNLHFQGRRKPLNAIALHCGFQLIAWLMWDGPMDAKCKNLPVTFTEGNSIYVLTTTFVINQDAPSKMPFFHLSLVDYNDVFPSLFLQKCNYIITVI